MHSGHAVIVQSMCSQCAITPLQYANSAPIVRFHKPSQFRSHLVRYFTKLCTSAIVSPQRTVFHLAMNAVVVVTLVSDYHTVYLMQSDSDGSVSIA